MFVFIFQVENQANNRLGRNLVKDFIVVVYLSVTRVFFITIELKWFIKLTFIIFLSKNF